MSRDALIVLHQEKSTPGKVGTCLEDRGFTLHRRCPCMGDPLPEDLSRYDALVVFGGPQSATDDCVEGIRAELDWLESAALPSGLPLLGICLGAQQIARVLGAPAGPRGDDVVEIGYYPVIPTEAGRAFLPQTTTFYQWHSETFGIPDSAVHLARSEAFEGQAFLYGDNVWAIEFHPEMTREMVTSWATSEGGSKKLCRPNAKPAASHIEGYEQFARESDAWLHRYIDEFFLDRTAAARCVA